MNTGSQLSETLRKLAPNCTSGRPVMPLEYCWDRVTSIDGNYSVDKPVEWGMRSE